MSLDPEHVLSTGPAIAVLPQSWQDPHRGCDLVVAIPANNEVERIPACLAALAMQRDDVGDPIRPGTFEVLLAVNNSIDATASTARALAEDCPFATRVVVQNLPPERANAGHARKLAMDLAADRLLEKGRLSGAILTTDADSRVAPTWISATRRAFAQGADCVAGYIDAEPAEILALGAAFLERGRLEDRYLRLVAEIVARCDPRPHDPWPNHRVSSGASLAVSLAAYQAIGGLPALALGEDAALTHQLERYGFRVRHAMDVCVSTSCRLDGRATGGAAETMRLRHQFLDAPCDTDLEPATRTFRRARLRGVLRHAQRYHTVGMLAPRMGIAPDHVVALEGQHAGCFVDLWDAIESISPVLARGPALRPCDLPAEIRQAERLLARLNGPLRPNQPVQSVDLVMQNQVREALASHLVHE